MSDAIDNPLVTFALFAYNQEKYICEAIEGAFAQDYSPLEIILSDDYSTDRTFEIMQEMAASYKGPHSVRTRRNSSNRGTLLHVVDVAEESKGEVFVLAAGDDVSKSWRCTELVRVFKETGAWAVYSYFDKIDEAGKLISKDDVKLLSWERMRDYWSDGKDMVLILGATSAYDRRAFRLIGNDVPRIMMEDSVMSAALRFADKKVVMWPKSLVEYRVSTGSLTNHEMQLVHSFQGYINDEINIAYRAGWYRDQNYLFVRLYDQNIKLENAECVHNFNRKLALSDAALYDMRSKWIRKSNLAERILFAMKWPSMTNLKWVIPRIFGLRFFVLVKIIFRLAS